MAIEKEDVRTVVWELFTVVHNERKVNLKKKKTKTTDQSSAMHQGK